MDTLDFDLVTFMLGRHETEQELAFNLKFPFGKEEDKLNVFFHMKREKGNFFWLKNLMGNWCLSWVMTSYPAGFNAMVERLG